MSRRSVIAACMLAALWPGVGVALETSSRPSRPWREIAWPYARDAWPKGKAFKCAGPACEGAPVLSVRVKRGFCDCTSGVRDDDEVDRVADIDLITQDFIATEPGGVISIAHFAGRMRSYEYGDERGETRTALGLALAHNCDLIAISVSSARTNVETLKEQVIARLQSQDILKWVNRQLGEK